jgi:hypothetical protein
MVGFRGASGPPSPHNRLTAPTSGRFTITASWQPPDASPDQPRLHNDPPMALLALSILSITSKEIGMGFEIALVILVVRAFYCPQHQVVPQQNAWVIERLGKYHGSLTPGLNFLVPFVDRVACKHSLKRSLWTMPSQVLHHTRQRSCGRRYFVFPGDRPRYRLQLVELHRRGRTVNKRHFAP